MSTNIFEDVAVVVVEEVTDVVSETDGDGEERVKVDDISDDDEEEVRVVEQSRPRLSHVSVYIL